MYQWKIGDDTSEWHTKSFPPSEMIDMGNPASGYSGTLHAHDVNLKEDFGVKPIMVDEGQVITILIKSPQDTERVEPYYGYSGSADDRKKIEGQEYEDFEIKDSDLNRNYTSVDCGQVPYILYNKA